MTKLASLKAGGRDGTLVVVNEGLTEGVAVPNIATTMQQALEQWKDALPKLHDCYAQLNRGAVSNSFALDPKELAAPLPRAYQWLDGSAYVNHVELVRKSRGAEMPESFWEDPLMYQGASDQFLGPCDPIIATSEDWGIDFESEVAVITDDVPMGVSREEAAKHICLVTILNDVSLRKLIPAELAKGFGFVHGKPATAFAPVMVTPDELGDAWQGGKLHLPLITELNSKVFGKPNAGEDMVFDFPTLIAHAAKTRNLVAGSVIGSGTVSNKNPEVGSSCILERRTLEKLNDGEIKTPFLKFGDKVKIDMKDQNGNSIFGAIEQEVTRG